MRIAGMWQRSIIFFCVSVGFLLNGMSLWGQSEQEWHAPKPDSWKIDYVYIEKMTDEDFLRISEFFTGKENTGFHLVLRTDPEQREGVYFIIGLNGNVKTLPKETQLQLNYILSTDSEPKLVYFTLPEGEGMSRELYVGLTGGANPLDGERPLAWKIEFIDPEKTVFLAEQSFLWAMPEKDNSSSENPVR